MGPPWFDLQFPLHRDRAPWRDYARAPRSMGMSRHRPRWTRASIGSMEGGSSDQGPPDAVQDRAAVNCDKNRTYRLRARQVLSIERPQPYASGKLLGSRDHVVGQKCMNSGERKDPATFASSVDLHPLDALERENGGRDQVVGAVHDGPEQPLDSLRLGSLMGIRESVEASLKRRGVQVDARHSGAPT